MREIVERRGEFHKHYDLEDGRQKIVHTLSRQHYRDDQGQWQDFDPTIQLDPQSGDWIAEKLPFKFKLHKNDCGFDYNSRGQGRVSLEVLGAANVTPTVAADRITYANAFTDCDVVFRIHRGGVQILRILKTVSAPKVFRFRIQTDAHGAGKLTTSIGRDAAGRELEIQSTTQGNVITDTWTGKTIVTDKRTRVRSLSDEVQYPVTIDPDVTESIVQNSDDGFEFFEASDWRDASASNKYNYWGYLEIVPATIIRTFHAGYRFQSVAVNQGETIALAELKLNRVKTYASTNDTAAIIYGTDEDDTATWDDTNRPSTQAKTSASTSVPASSGTGITAYDVTSIVQEIVNRGGWSSGNDMSLFILNNETGSFLRFVYIEDYAMGGSNPAKLEITFGGGGGLSIPVAMHSYRQRRVMV